MIFLRKHLIMCFFLNWKNNDILFYSINVHLFIMNSKLTKFFANNDIHTNSKTTILTVEMQEILGKSFGKNMSIKLYSNKISSSKDYNDVPIMELLDLVTINDYKNFKYVTSYVDGISQQTIFTYTLSTFIETFFPSLTFTVEENFFNALRFNDLKVSTKKGPRIDILFDSIKLVIEFDEKHHKYQIKEDLNRDLIVKTYGYKTIRYSCFNVDNDFFEKLKIIINEQILLHDLSTLFDYVLSIFKDHCDEDIIKLLLEEECDDIINNLEYSIIGKTPKNITLSTILQITNNYSVNEEVSEFIIDEIKKSDLPYIYDDENDDYIVCPLLKDHIFNIMPINANSNVVYKFRKLMSDVKNRFMYYIHERTRKMQIENEERMKTIVCAINNGYERGRNENMRLINNLKKDVCTSNNRFMRLAESIFKQSTKLCDDKYIIKEIPEIVYTTDTSTYITFDDIVDLIMRKKCIGTLRGNNAAYYVKKISEKLYGKSKIANNGQFFNCKINLALLT